MVHKAKKSLGQNFLKSQLALSQIIKAGEINKKDTIIEIGPGKGALTIKLLDVAGHVIAIEKDSELVELLKEKFKKEILNKKLTLIEGDVLNYEPEIRNYKLIANIPYNITGAIFKKFLTGKNKPETMVLLVQKEVAERIVVKDKKESILSISVKAYGTPKYIAKVSKKYFSPSPKVDSAILQITNISSEVFTNKKSEEMFFKILKTGFAHKRKLLIKNLSQVFEKESLENIFNKYDISLKSRAENIHLKNWINITKEIDQI